MSVAAHHVVGLVLAAMGLAALWRPALVWRPFGGTPATADLRNEVRAVYGGFGLAVGSLLTASAGWPALAAGVRLALAVALLGMAGGRLVGFAVERAGAWPWCFAVLEAAAGAALWCEA